MANLRACLLCEAELRADQRRNINNKSSESVKAVIKELATKTSDSATVDEVLRHSSPFLCRTKCYKPFEKLRSDTKVLEDSLEEIVRRRLNSKGETTATQSRKRSHSPPNYTECTKRRRESANTPVRVENEESTSRKRSHSCESPPKSIKRRRESVNTPVRLLRWKKLFATSPSIAVSFSKEIYRLNHCIHVGNC